MIQKKNKLKKEKISVIGLGYVGLPLAIEFSKKFKVVGYDINKKRVEQLINKYDNTNEVSTTELQNLKNIKFTSCPKEVSGSKIFIVTIPTPVDTGNKPDLTPLKKASKFVASVIKKNDIVIYESTVYPGATEEVCVPILEKHSGLKFNKEFFCGYSPERINPGDKERRLVSIKKIVSGSNYRTTIKIDKLYRQIIKAGTHIAPSIKVAEAAKVIENTQRDVNIALINEFTIIFNKLNIDTTSVLEAANTKWNFLPFQPGLVGGHCIGVDPYYLAFKAKKIGLNPKMIISGRNINDNMASHVVKQIKKLMFEKSIKISNSNLLVMGLTFKENCPDIRNTKIIDLIKGLKKLKINIDVYDPIANKDEVLKKYGLNLINKPKKNKYDTIVFAVKHKEFKSMKVDTVLNFCKKKNLIYDLKNIFPNNNKIMKL